MHSFFLCFIIPLPSQLQAKSRLGRWGSWLLVLLQDSALLKMLHTRLHCWLLGTAIWPRTSRFLLLVIWGLHLLHQLFWWQTRLFGPSMSSFGVLLLLKGKWTLQWNRWGPGLWLQPRADILCQTGQALWPIRQGVLLHLSCSLSFLLVGLSWWWWDVPKSSGIVFWRRLLERRRSSLALGNSLQLPRMLGWYSTLASTDPPLPWLVLSLLLY